MALTLNGDDGIAGVDGSATTPAIQGTDSNTGISFGTDTVNVVTGGSTRTTVDSSGRLLVGLTTGNNRNFLQIQGDVDNGATGVGGISLRRGHALGSIGDGSSLGQIDFCMSDGGVAARILGEAEGAAATNDYPGRLEFYTTEDSASSPTERMRITSTGSLRFGQNTTNTPSQSATAGVALNPQGQVNAWRDGGSAGVFGRAQDGVVIQWYRGGSQVGTVTVASGSTAYNTTSDYRLKENVVPLTGAIDRVNQLQVHRFNFIADPDKTVDGFLAHEAQTVVPEAVTGTHDEVDDEGNPVMQGIDQSKLVPLLTAALQEAISKIEALETRVAQLEGGAS